MIDLKSVRESAGISQNMLARMCGKVRQTIGNIEIGKTLPSVMLAKQFGIIFNIDWTLFFEDIKPVVLDLSAIQCQNISNVNVCQCLNCSKPFCDNCIG